MVVRRRREGGGGQQTTTECCSSTCDFCPLKATCSLLEKRDEMRVEPRLVKERTPPLGEPHKKKNEKSLVIIIMYIIYALL